MFSGASFLDFSATYSAFASEVSILSAVFTARSDPIFFFIFSAILADLPVLSL